MRLLAFLRIWRGELAAVAGGCLWAFSFPKFEFSGGAWIAPGIILFAGLGQPTKMVRLGYVAGLIHYLISLYWLLFIPFPSGAITGWLALSAYLAVYPAVWVWLCRRLLPASASWFEIGLLRRSVWLAQCGMAWVVLELAVTWVLSGFPWNLLGASQYRAVPLLQVASVSGIYGVSFLVAWLSVSLVGSALLIGRQPSRRWQAFALLAPPFCAVFVASLWGTLKVLQHPPPGRTLKAALIQPSIPQTLIWDERENTNRFSQLVKLSEAALATRPDLLIWPEAALPTMLRYNEDTAKAVIKLARDHHVWIVLGSDDAVPEVVDAIKGQAQRYKYYNSAFAVDPTGTIAGVYRKRRLVMFGEYVPLQEWLPFLKHFTPVGENGFSAGEGPAVFEMSDLGVKLSVLICFEDVFPSFSREYVREDTDFLLNLTNNGWFGESAAQWQHAANAVFRAVENGLPLVRCANNGLTCWVDSRGRMHEVYFGDSSDIYGVGFKTAQIPLLEKGKNRPKTFYSRHGDLFAIGCTVLTLAGLVLTYKSRGRSSY
jgi:apolipoprotein N-acyltransferase